MNIRKRTWTWRGEKRVAYQLDWRVSGRRHQKQFATRREVELYRDRMIRERSAEQFGTLIDDAIVFDKFSVIYFMKKPWRTETYRARADWSVKALSLHFGSAKLTAITPAEIEEYQAVRFAAKRSASTVRQELATLSDMFRWAIKLHYATSNPCRDIERPSLPVKQDSPADYLPPEDFAALVAKAGRDLPLYEFAVFTGLRESELLVLEWSDIKDGHVLVRRGKGRKQRLVPLVAQAESALAKVPRRLKEPRIFWWVNSRFETYKRFRRRLRWAELDAKGYKFHTLRHTFGSYAAMSGVDLEVIAEGMGHSRITVTKLYAHLSPDYKRRQLLKMASIGPMVTREQQESRNIAKGDGL